MKKQKLPKEEIDFGSLPKAELERAWLVEHTREAYRYVGQPPYIKPYLLLDKSLFEFERFFAPVIEVPLQRAALLGIDLLDFGKRHGTSDARVFLVNWDKSKLEIENSLKSWLDISYPVFGQCKKSKAGRRRDYLSWLCDLAIYRAAKAGYTRKEAEILLTWIKNKAGRSTAFVPGRFTDAQKRTESRIKKLLAGLPQWLAEFAQWRKEFEPD